MARKKIEYIDVAFLVDPCGSDFGNMTPEDEIADSVEWFNGQLEEKLGKGYKVRDYRIHCMDANDIKPGTKAIMFDFGGMLWGNDLAADNSRSLLKFAEDNPSVMIMVTSSFTWHHCFIYEMRDMCLENLPNVCSQEGTSYELPKWFTDMVRK